MGELLIITNADDLGLNSQVNAQVEVLHQKGVLSSATIMANGGAIHEIKDLHDRNPNLGLGVHLNATNFRALTPAMRESVLCDVSGSFASNFRDHNRFGLSDVLAKEWMAQIKLVQGMGISIDHLDSHHHVHTWPSALPALRRVSRETGIPWVRNTRNIVPMDELVGAKSKLKYAGKSLWTLTSRMMGMKLTDGFCSVWDFRRCLEEGDGVFTGLKTIELMCHPGDLGNSEYIKEADWLSEGFLKTLKSGWSLASYKDLA